MNDNLKQLYKQACRGPWYKDDQGSFDSEKFAELIVRECAGLFKDDGAISSMAEYVHNSRVRSTILAHFGIQSDDT